MKHVVRTVCPHDCPDQCSILATVEDGQVVRVAGDPDHPFTRGFLCAKVNRYPERVHSPERLLHPMRRVGPKGEGRFERISWEEALESIAERWRQVGPEAILGYAYSGTMGMINRNLPTALFNALGTRRMQTGTVCDTACDAGWAASLGEAVGSDPESMAASDLIIAWGANLVTTNVHSIPFVDEARSRGAKLVVIDPYRTRTAARADWHLPIRVGTDAALALGIMHVLERDNLLDHLYLAAHTTGFEELRTEVLPRYSPERVAAITGLEAAEIERLARMYGEAQAPFIRIGMGMSRNSGGGMAIRTVTCLPALVGAWEKKGGGALIDVAGAYSFNTEAVRLNERHPRPDEAPVNHARLGEALQDPSLKAFLVMSNNPATTCPDQGAVIAGLSREDLFTVVHDILLTDTARYADILLPACTPMETDDLYRSYGSLYYQFGPQLIEPLGESRPNRWVVSELARLMGVTNPVFSRSTEEHLQALLAPMGVTADQVMTAGPVRVERPEAPVHTAFLNPDLMAMGLPALPEWQPDPVEAEEGAIYGLRLLTAPGHYQHHSAFAGVAWLQEREGAPCCLIHPSDAAARQITDGAGVELHNQRGLVGLIARVTTDVPPGLVVVEGQRSRQRYLKGGSVNVLTSSRLSDLGEGATYQSTWVEARPLTV
ncbi:MAG: molybdopterin-containing oxidoreductase family protein [Bacillota bacterium]